MLRKPLWLAFVLWCWYCWVSFQLFVLRHLVTALVRNTDKLPINHYTVNKSAIIALKLYIWNRSITVKINNAGGRHCTKRLGDLKLCNYLPVTEGKKIAKRIKNEVVTSDLTSPSYAPASTPGETSSFFRYLLFQLSISNANKLLYADHKKWTQHLVFSAVTKSEILLR